MHGFEILKEQTINELKTDAILFRHTKTRAEILSLKNDDSNKVFGITFRTPPSDSTGIAHILEHSVLCGSRKYPVKEPFIELIKGSLQTFLNAFTYPDKTCYPVASQNMNDFYNLVDVYLDAVFYPRLTPLIFQQEAWHYEIEHLTSPMFYKGVVFNEMKGAHSSPDSLLAHYSQQSIFPDVTYGFDAGGDPKRIPDLTYERFINFHKSYYHPSNCRIYFYGDDDPEKRLCIISEYLKDFDYKKIDTSIPFQPLFSHLKTITKSYPSGAGNSTGKKSMVTVNWLLEKTIDTQAKMALQALEYILLGMPASPLRKALIDSGLGDGIAGCGLETELQQMYFSTGLKGIAAEDSEKIVNLIINTLSALSDEGIDPRTVEASINTIEFRLRENNSGSFPRGLLIMLRALTSWLYEGDPFSSLAFENALNNLKLTILQKKFFFEELITGYFLSNNHRSIVILKPDSTMAEEEEQSEVEKLSNAKSCMTPDELQSVIESCKELKLFHQTPDPPEAMATIPTLKLSDIERENNLLPIHCYESTGSKILYHDIFTSGIFYFDIGLNLRLLPQEYLPYIPLFGRCLLESGTKKHSFVSLSQLISQKTGGIRTGLFTSTIKDSRDGAAWLFLRGKSMLPQVADLLSILSDVLLSAQLDNKNRFKQILHEEKAAQEQKIIPLGHKLVNSRLRSHFSEADWADEQMSGISYLFFLRDLERKLDEGWKEIHSRLEKIRQILINHQSIVLNITVDEKNWLNIESCIFNFIEMLPGKNFHPEPWKPDPIPEYEGLIMPSLVNYVGKGINLYDTGYSYHGSVHVIMHFLRTTWLWEQVRVQGGAYGASCGFDSFSGGLTFVSYRDPNILNTLDIFDQTPLFLSALKIDMDELQKSIIGAIGDVDTYMLPDTKGYISMQRYLNNNTDESRRRMRNEILNTTLTEFKTFAVALNEVKEKGIVKVLASEKAIIDANKSGRISLKTFNVF